MRSLVIAFALASGCTQQGAHCLALCAEHAHITASTDVAASGLADARIAVCVASTVCSFAVLGAPQPITAAGNFDARIELSSSAGGLAVVTIDVAPPQRGWFQDGDVWSVTITDAGGAVLYTANATARYEISPPDCEGYTCRTLDLQL